MFRAGILESGVKGPSGHVATATYGYFAGGNSGAVVTTADRITFSTGATSANTASNLSTARRFVSGLSDKVTYGYFLGGSTATSAGQVVTTDRIVFSTSITSANTVSNLALARYSCASVSSGSTYGYTGGGRLHSLACQLLDSIGEGGLVCLFYSSQVRNVLFP
jgi:hypothetical protein